MKNTGKNSSNKRSDDTLIYLFLAALIAAVVGILVYYLLQPPNKPKTSIDYSKTELGERIVNPTSEQVSKLLLANESWEKTIERGLESVNKKLSADQKAEIRKEFESLKSNFNNFVKNVDLRMLDSEQLARFYSQLYEQGKTLVRLKSKITNDRPPEEWKKQWEVTQQEWEISAEEERETNEQLKRLIPHWYNQFMDNKLTEEERKLIGSWVFIEPVMIEGRKVTAPASPDDINFFKKPYNFPSGEFVDLTKPTRAEFKGYGGFMTLEDLKGSTEGTMTMGITLSPKKESGNIIMKNSEGVVCSHCHHFPDNFRPSVIKLRKELFFNREGYDEWISKLSKDNNYYYDITWGSVVETIAHELAHAVINCLWADYEGEKTGGHGKLHDDFQERIEKMMRESDEFEEFKTWWEKKKKK